MARNDVFYIRRRIATGTIFLLERFSRLKRGAGALNIHLYGALADEAEEMECRDAAMACWLEDSN